MDKMWKIKEIAELLKLNQATIWRYIDAGKLKSLRVGVRAIRVRDADLKEWIGLKEE